MTRPGYIKLYRQIEETPLWLAEPFSKAQAWVDLLMLANFAPADVLIKNMMVHIERGQLLWSQQHLSERWKWGVKKVRNFLKLLEKQKMVTSEGTPQGTLITIVNYEFYQGEGQAKGTPQDTAKGELWAGEGQYNKKNKEELNKNDNNYLTDNLPADYSSYFQQVIKTWVSYKESKSEAYNRISLDEWLQLLAEKYKRYDEKYISDVIRTSIANQYKNVAWDMLADAPRRRRSPVPAEEENLVPKDLPTEEERAENIRKLQAKLGAAGLYENSA